MAESSASSRMRLLYVDDDAVLVRYIQKVLGRLGFDLVHAASGEDALAAIAAGGFDVVALDHFLTSGTGLHLLGEISKLSPSPPVVYVTGSSETSVAVAALKGGAADFVPKSVGEDFVELLRAALDQAVEKSRLKVAKENADREVYAARARAEMLLVEVNHRVANSLSIVASMVRLQANLVEDEIARESLSETEARISAIALVHKRLYSTGDVTTVQLDEYLGTLLDHLENALQREGQGPCIYAEFCQATLKTDSTINLGVIVTEWVTNAFKYAYPEGAGQVRVLLRSVGADKLELTVADDGTGRNEHAKPQGTGLGTRLVKAMAASMNGEFSYPKVERGTTARLLFSQLIE